MMKVFILLSVVATTLASRQCGENEHFESCGTACPLTCENYDNPPKFCVLSCDIGCHCDKGYVRSSDGRCVRPEECPVRVQEVCGENQRYSECGSACPLTCENYENPPLICPDMCVMGCECKKGFVETKDGRCVKPEDCPSRSGKVEENCFDEPAGGNCAAFLPMWYYDAHAGECKEFTVGGCGNTNRFTSKEECTELCSGVGPLEPSLDICDLPAKTGTCRSYFQRFYFDKTTGQCKRFVYGGCDGNENNFKDQETCEKTCSEKRPKACRLPKISGRCRGYFSRFYYNAESRKCENFIYGGCDGNANNFNSREECETVCNV